MFCTRLVIAAAVVGFVAGPSRVVAVDYYWDTNGSSPGVGSTTPSADWLDANWTATAAGTGAVSSWPNGAPSDDTAIFTGSSGTVVVDALARVNALEFSTSGYNVTADGGSLLLEGSDPTIDISLPNNGNSITISAPITGTEGLTLTGNTSLGAGRLTFLVLANNDAANPNAFSGEMVIEASASLRIGGAVGREQIPDSVDLRVEGVIDYVTSGGASDGKHERVRNVVVAGTDAIFSVGNGSGFEANRFLVEDTFGGPGASLNGNNASQPGVLSVTGWADGDALLELRDSRLRINTTGGTSAIGGRIHLHGDILSSGASEISNANGRSSSASTNTFTNKALDFLAPWHEIDVADGVLALTSASSNHPLEVTSDGSLTALIKTGAGTLTYDNAVQTDFVGTNRVDEGVLLLDAPERLDDDSSVVIKSGGLLDLDFSGQETVRHLVLDGVPRTAGTYGALGNGAADFQTSLIEGSGLLNVTNSLAFGLPGDFNGDGSVDAADYTVWRDTQDQSVATPGAGADGDFSGVIDQGDYAVWVANFGALAPSNSVPEPASAVLALAAVLFVANKRRNA